EVKEVKHSIKAVKDNISTVKDYVNRRFDEVNEKFNSQTNSFLAFERNRLAHRLETGIDKVEALVEGGTGKLRTEVAPEFPITVRQFWLLRSKSKRSESCLSALTSVTVLTIQRLARHYSIDEWKIRDSGNPDATQ